VTLLLAPAGCTPRAVTISADDPELREFVQRILPRKIDIQHNLTRPVSFDGSGDADGIELILETTDSYGHEVKCVGSLLVELYGMRMASADKFGPRLAFWTIDIHADDTLGRYWDNLARCFRFPLMLDDHRLKPGRYILKAQLQTLGGEKLFDEYHFGYVGRPVPTASTSN